MPLPSLLLDIDYRWHGKLQHTAQRSRWAAPDNWSDAGAKAIGLRLHCLVGRLRRTPMVFNIGCRLRRRTQAEFDRPETVAFIQRPRSNVRLMRVEFEPRRG